MESEAEFEKKTMGKKILKLMKRYEITLTDLSEYEVMDEREEGA